MSDVELWADEVRALRSALARKDGALTDIRQMIDDYRNGELSTEALLTLIATRALSAQEG